MCDLRPRICFNYDRFERLPMVTLRRDVFETQYISRATFDAEVARLTALVNLKNDALDSYAEFYGRAAGMCGLPDDALPGAQTDAIILQRLAEHDEIARLTAELDKINHVLRGTGFRIASDARPGFGYVLIGHGVEYVPVDDEVGGMI